VVVSNGALSNGQIVITAGGYNTPSCKNGVRFTSRHAKEAETDEM